ncbi:hypothetical protein SOCE26_075720 [Sorangium cellulosum]|uniref:Uncharacterized protein n=1 Tax=Sorangium cellulosum TaxID=56 RepID=A0A2L0F3N9_SORCE|nr:hypothetical protein [Sorangium cellulosum]AUX46069.1 hypothetical protein SOCE26_075720 [Sorangium cellulosum]
MVSLVACGGASSPPAEPDPEATEAAAGAPPAESGGEKAEGGGEKKEEDAASDAARQVPTTCEERDGMCLPPPAFVKRLCSGFHPDVALSLFAKGTPFTRGYLTRDTEAWNASGGSSSNDKLLFDEEVLILYRRVADTGGMVVSGAGGGYDVLRWDGTCASLMTEEVRLHVPPKPKFAPIPWKSLDQKTREAFQADEKVGKLVAERRKECKGATMGAVSAKCEKVDKQMGAALIEYVRGGGTLPAPGPLP